MTPKTFASGPKACRVEILLARDFVATELAAAFDGFRIANRLEGRQLFTVRRVSVEGRAGLTSLGGIEIATQTVPPDLPDILIVTGGPGMVRARQLFLPRLQRVRLQERMALVLSDAAQALITSGATDSAAVHCERLPLLEEVGLAHRGRNALFTRSGRLITGAVMAATADAVLALIGEVASPLLAHDVARVLLLDRPRQPETEQPGALSDVPGLPDGLLRKALRIMETTPDYPVPTGEIVRRIGLSIRQLGRIFAPPEPQSAGLLPEPATDARSRPDRCEIAFDFRDRAGLPLRDAIAFRAGLQILRDDPAQNPTGTSAIPNPGGRTLMATRTSQVPIMSVCLGPIMSERAGRRQGRIAALRQKWGCVPILQKRPLDVRSRLGVRPSFVQVTWRLRVRLRM